MTKKLRILTGVLAVLVVLPMMVAPSAGLSGFGSHYLTDGIVSGSGTGGSGSIAFASFFSSTTSSGVGSFTGTLAPNGATVQDVTGVWLTKHAFQLPVPLPPGIVDLNCAPAGQVEVDGGVVSGNFLGNSVTIYGCSGTDNVVAVAFKNDIGAVLFLGKGIGNTVTASAAPQTVTLLTGNSIGTSPSGIRTVAFTAFFMSPLSVGMGTLNSKNSGQAQEAIATTSLNKLFPIVQPICGVGGGVGLGGIVDHVKGTEVWTSLAVTMSACLGAAVPATITIGSPGNIAFSGTGTDYCVQYRETDF